MKAEEEEEEYTRLEAKEEARLVEETRLKDEEYDHTQLKADEYT